MLAELIRSGCLVKFEPLCDPDDSDFREIYMIKSLHAWCYQSDRKKTSDFKSNVRAFLAQFVQHRNVDNQQYMKSWTDHVFEFRVQISPKRENHRIFGVFVASDLFVATHVKPRSAFKGKRDPAWAVATDLALERAVEMFPGHGFVRSTPFGGCVTSNAYDAIKGHPV